MKSYEDEALEAKGGDRLPALARWVWATDHGPGAMPANKTPTERDLARFLPDCPQPARDAASAALGRLVQHEKYRDSSRWIAVDEISGMDEDGPWLMAAAASETETYALAGLGTVLSLWARNRRMERDHAAARGAEPPPPHHPLAPIVRAWQALPSKAVPFHPKPRASLPSLHRLTERDTLLPALDGFDAPAGSQLVLPGFESPIQGCPSWLLWLYDTAGGEALSAGRGAPWDLRLFVGALLHLEIRSRDGGWRTLRFPHLRQHEADWPVPDTPSIEAWLHPDGWTNRRRDWHRLPEALHRMRRDLGWVPVPGLGSVAMLFPSVIPKSPDDPVVEFTIRIPQSAARGARMNWPRWQGYAMESAALARADLAVAAHLDRAAHAGHPITQRIAPPLLDAAGQPIRREDGGIERSETETVDNPAARFVPVLSDADLARMIGFDPTDKRRRHDARKALDRLAADGVIELAPERGGRRIFGPAKAIPAKANEDEPANEDGE